jgi:hypothetical protein
MTNPIETAVAPLKNDAIRFATREAIRSLVRIREALEAHGWDLNAVAPYPDSWNMSAKTYHVAKNKRAMFEFVTKRDATHAYDYRRGSPYFVTLDRERMAHHVKNNQEIAAMQYEMFVAKLIHKIGPCATAVLDGNHVWSYSVLTVTFPDKATETWKTQQISNISKLGKWFPQWPTRKLKRGG